ncbi:hypothetical protein L209DRAFT_454039 [Thermothelomyces heterothallicus CBS 203.75]
MTGGNGDASSRSDTPSSGRCRHGKHDDQGSGSIGSIGRAGSSWFVEQDSSGRSSILACIQPPDCPFNPPSGSPTNAAQPPPNLRPTSAQTLARVPSHPPLASARPLRCRSTDPEGIG